MPISSGVVVHLDEGGEDKQSAVLRNITNLLAEMGDDTPVELVTHGLGISICLADSPVAATVADLISRGVVVACANTLRSQGIDADRLIDGVVTVPAGVAELVRKQRAGWAYIRP